MGRYPPATPRNPMRLIGLRGGRGSVFFEKESMYYTYILKSEKDGKLYVGYTDDLDKRFTEHQKGLVKSTAERRPLRLVYYEACLDKNKALKREKYFKTGFGRRYLKNRI
ncbi:MAG: GIY-YIG nuclease family protein [Patescibacteria group bacterium]